MDDYFDRIGLLLMAIVAAVAASVFPIALVLGWLVYQLTVSRRLLIHATRYWETQTELEPVAA